MTPSKFCAEQKGRQEERILTEAQLRQRLRLRGDLDRCVLIGLDLESLQIDWSDQQLQHTTFLGCTMRLEEELHLRKLGAYIYQHPDHLPYNPYRAELYHWRELMEGFSFEQDRSVDFQIYDHFSQNRINPGIHEALCQRIHDHGIDDALRQLLQFDETGMTNRRCVGFMGGHSVLRTDPYYLKAATTAKLLAEAGYFIVSGGGPGIMEAANFGAYMANRTEEEFELALSLLLQAPHYQDRAYHLMAYEVLDRFPEGGESLAVPTWFYGHEPSNLFGSHIAKYFSNSIREDTLLAICLHGIVFAPGSAGTTQEIFQDATQNHYGTFNYFSPMIFLGRQRYELDTLIYPLLRQLSFGKTYHDLLFITDEPTEVLSFLDSHPPILNEDA
jgi:predicted Rossmann-fold nucleotide-binding protein